MIQFRRMNGQLWALALTMASLPGAAAAEAQASADDLLIVDCLLPGQIRQLGRRTTYVSARRAVRTTARDCEIRGGEYVAYDRANYRTALNVWLPLAKGGDTEAQLNVGEIFEKGLGERPDYEAAAAWYTRAAEAGDARAQVNLAHLYETGLGVPLDPARARDWYRRAAGLPVDIELDPTGLSADVAAEDAAELEGLRKELQTVQAEANRLRSELAETRARLDENQDQAEASASAAAAREMSREQRVRQLDEMLAATQQALRSAQSEIEKKELASARQREELDRARAELAAQGSAAESQRAELERLQRELEEREQSLAEERAAVSSLDTQLQALQAQAAREKTVADERKRAVPMAGPSIVIVDPEVAETRGVAVVESGASALAFVSPDLSSRALVGRVESPAGLMSLTVNGASIEPNEQGVFAADITLAGTRTPVEVVAVDNQGKRSARSLTFVAQSANAGSAVTADAKPALPPIDFGQFHALIIGNNEYTSLPRLTTPISDARDLDRILREHYGFETRLLENATRYQILSALNSLREELTPDDNLLIYYAGHGELDEINMRGHWLPVDAERESSANWISNVAVTDILNVMRANHILVIADSCYSGSLTRSALTRLQTGMTDEERDNWLRTMTKQRSRVVLTSGGLAPVLDQGGGNHSVFNRALQEVLATNERLLVGQRLYQEVAARVAYAAANMQFDQVPEYAPIRFAGHEAGDFFFVPR